MKGSVDNENVRPNLKRKRSPSLTKYRKCYRSNSKNRGENRERGSYRSSRIDLIDLKVGAEAEAIEEATGVEAEVNIINVTLEGKEKKMWLQTTLLGPHNR